MAEELVIVSPFVSIRENFKSLSNLLKLSLCRFPMLFVFVRVPLSSQFFIGTLNFEEGGILGYSEDGIVVFE